MLFVLGWFLCGFLGALITRAIDGPTKVKEWLILIAFGGVSLLLALITVALEPFCWLGRKLSPWLDKRI